MEEDSNLVVNEEEKDESTGTGSFENSSENPPHKPEPDRPEEENTEQEVHKAEGEPDLEEPQETEQQASDDLNELFSLHLSSMEEKIFNRFDGLARLFESRLAYDEGKDEQIRSLHSELQEYKQDLLLKVLQPYVKSIIRMHDNISRTLDHLEEKTKQEESPLDPAAYMKIIDGFRDELELILDQNGVESFEHPGDEFDPRCQMALKRIDTDKLELKKAWAKRVRKGFRKGEKIIQKERVSVYVYHPPSKLESPQSEHSPGK